MPRINVFHRLCACAVFVAAAVIAAAQSGTYYRDGPRASDADRIATEMLNDAASGRFRQPGFGRPNNPFDQKIIELENARRARAAEQSRYAADAQRRRAEIAADERREAEDRARQRQADEKNRRFESLQEAARNFDAQAHLQLGLLVESGRFTAKDRVFPAGMTPATWALERYQSAILLGLDVGVVAYGCMEKKVNPGFHELWDRVLSLPTAAARQAYLAGSSDQGHLGGSLWLGAWHAGFNVSLGQPPEPPDAGDDHRRAALRYLERAHRKGYTHATAWLAETLLSGLPTPAERTRALALMEGLLAPGPDREPAAVPAYARELLRDARVEADCVRPRALLAEFEKIDYLRGLTAWAAMHLDGTDGEYHPGRAARILNKVPNTEYFGVHHVRRHLSAGIDAYFGIDSPVSHRTAADQLVEAVTAPARVRGGPSAADRHLRTDAQLWLAFVRAEAGMTTPDMPDPAAYLTHHASSDYPLSMLLDSCAALGRPGTSAQVAHNTWIVLALLEPFARPLSPPETLLVLRCALRAHERGGLPELAPFVAEIKALAPMDAPIQGAAILARLYFTHVHSRDIADRKGLAHLYATLVRAAWRNPKLWESVAALVEVLQVDPLSAEQWNSGWLAPFLEKHPAASAEQRRWAAQLAAPAPQSLGSLTLDKYASLSLRNPGPPEIQALDASLRIRGATTDEQARLQARRLLRLAGAGHWHAQALVEDFAERYRPSYARRRDLDGFRRDAREAAEAVADWCLEGHGFVVGNDEQRMRAIGTAIACGSTRFTRDLLEDAAKRNVVAARIALLRLDALAADKRTLRERDDDEIAEALSERR